MAGLIQKVKENPLQAVTVAIAVVGVVFSVFNFYLLANISPLTRRVEALEKVQEENLPYVLEFIAIKQDVLSIKEDVAEIKVDIKRILDLHISR